MKIKCGINERTVARIILFRLSQADLQKLTFLAHELITTFALIGTSQLRFIGAEIDFFYDRLSPFFRRDGNRSAIIGFRFAFRLSPFLGMKSLGLRKDPWGPAEKDGEKIKEFYHKDIS